MEAEINGDTVLMGTAGFMFRMGIRVHENVNVKNAVFIAVNMELAGVFNVNYKINHEIRRSLISLIRKKVTPVLAAIDFNLTPVMLESESRCPSVRWNTPRWRTGFISRTSICARNSTPRHWLRARDFRRTRAGYCRPCG